MSASPPIKFYLFQMIPYLSKTILAGDINSLNLRVAFRFVALDDMI